MAIVSQVRERLRFSEDEKIIVLREVVSENPFEDPKRWDKVVEKVRQGTGRDFAKRNIKGLVERLVTTWNKEDSRNRSKSGGEEVVSEKDNLTQELGDMMRDFSKMKNPNKENSRELGILSRSMAGETMKNASSEINDNQLMDNEETSLPSTSTSVDVITEDNVIVVQPDIHAPPLYSFNEVQTSRRPRKRPMRTDALRVVEERERNRNELERKKIQLEQEKLKVEKEKLELEKAKFELEKDEKERLLRLQEKEREERLKMEMEERKQHLLEHLLVMNTHKKMIDFLMNHLKEK